MAKFISDGAVELYHNNVKTFETTASGAKIHGNTGDAVLLEADTGNNDEADNAYIEFTQDGGGVSAKSGIGVDGNNRYQVSTTTGGGTTKFDIHGGAETRLYYASDIKLETESNGVTITSSSGDTKLFIEADPSNSNEGDNAFLIFKLDGGFETSAVWSGNFGGSNDNALNLTNAGQFGGGIRFGTTTTNNAWETATERMRIDRHGDITTFGTNGNITFDYSADSLIFDDNVEAKFGTGGDLRIYHNGSNSYIDEGSGEGALIFKSNIFSFRNAPDSQQMALFNQGGNVRLFHAGAEKFPNSSTGAKVFGDLTIVNSDDDANANPSLIIDRGSSSPANSDAIGEIIFRGRDSGGAGTDYANIAAVIGDVTDPQEDAYLRFRARVGGANIQHIQCGFSTTDIFAD